MLNKNKKLRLIKDLLSKMEIDTYANYLTTKQVEIVYGIPRKTLLNRSNLSFLYFRVEGMPTHSKYLKQNISNYET